MLSMCSEIVFKSMRINGLEDEICIKPLRSYRPILKPTRPMMMMEFQIIN